MRKLIALTFLALVTTALAEDSAQTLIDKAIVRAGGMEAWNATRTVQFRRTTTRFNPDGSVASTRVQQHQYELHPSPRMRIEWQENGQTIVMINNGNEAAKFVDGKRATAQEDIDSARGSTFGGHYVFGMPWKLRDPGTRLADAGTHTLEDGTVVQKVRVTYDKGAGDAGGKHTWTYMFDPESGRLVCHHLEYEPGKFSWTEYYDEKRVGSLTFPTRRVGYDADGNSKTGPKKSETVYEEIQTNVELPPKLFEFPRG